MNTYSASLCASRETADRIDIRHVVAVIVADNAILVNEKADQRISELWPERDGWKSHGVSIVEVK